MLAEERARYEAEADALTTTLADAEARAQELAQELATAERAAADADRALAELSRTLAGQQADYVELARRLAAQKAEQAAVRTRRAQRAGEMADIQTALTARVAEAETARRDAATLRERQEAARTTESELRRTLAEEHEPARRQAGDTLTATRERRTAAERRLAEQNARLRVLRETEAAQEGYFAGVRAVTGAVKTGQIRGRYQVVADALRVPENLDTAVEIALGASLQDIITDTEAEAKAAIAFLKESRDGRATFLPLDALRAQEVPDSLRRAARQWSGVLGSAADLVGHDVDVAPAVRVLLARILFVDDLDTATRVSRQIDGWAKIVTLTGEVVVPTGAITGGTTARTGPQLLGRKREIAELAASVVTTENNIRQLQTDETAAQAAREAAQAAVGAAEAAAAQAREQAAEAGRQAQARENEAVRLIRDTEARQARAGTLAEADAADARREESLAATLEAAGAADAGAQVTREEMQARQGQLAMTRGEALAQARMLGVELAGVRERALSARRDSDRARSGIERAVRTAQERTRRAEEAAAIIAEEDANAAERITERDRARTAQAEAQALLEGWRETRQALLAENFALSERIKVAERGARTAAEQAQAARLRAARVETQAEGVAVRLSEEYELSPDAAITLTGGAPPERDIAQEIGRLRREIKVLGNVNTGAVEEYERLSERSRFLEEQQADLAAARESLTAAITEIDDSTRGIFMETFQAVGRSFAGLFARLFGGGSAELVLTDPDDILETGIEIIAQPPGKKRQSLALLSGGERALTAAALLFAFLEVKPAPFCVLDEVDAPLDGANVEKFGDLLREFGQRMQFIVITHNATTMEAAPLWYGITMQEPGISRGLSMQVTEADPAIALPALPPPPSPLPHAVGEGEQEIDAAGSSAFSSGSPSPTAWGRGLGGGG